MMATPLGLIFTIEVDGKPTVAFEGARLREAAELCSESWFRDDLSRLSSNGDPLYRTTSKLRARTASDNERALFVEGAAATSPSDDILLVYLVDLDGP
jgi:hypothetical protein